MYLLGSGQTTIAWYDINFKDSRGHLAKWMEELGQFDIRIRHRSGKTRQKADGLSRIPDTVIGCNCFGAGKGLTYLP